MIHGNDVGETDTEGCVQGWRERKERREREKEGREREKERMKACLSGDAPLNQGFPSFLHASMVV